MRVLLCLARLILLMMGAMSAAVAKDRLVLTGELIQGGMLVGHALPGAWIRFEGHSLRVGPDGEFAIGFGRDAPSHMRLVVHNPDGSALTRQLSIRQRHYHIQRISGLPPRQVTPDKADLLRIRQEAAEIRQARRVDSPRTDFDGQWIWPVTGVITGVYGSQRILNGKPRSPHTGVDIAAPAGTPVRAPANGVVRLCAPALFFSGGTVILDHGHGISTTYVHLRRIDVHEGQVVRQGQVLGEVGATGRATGPNLHWGLNWFEQRLDPSLLVPAMAEARSGH